MTERDRGAAVAGRLVGTCEVVGLFCVVGALCSIFVPQHSVGAPEWVAASLFMIGAALAIGLAANAVLRR